MDDSSSRWPLTDLSEEERLFSESVREFAEQEIAPLAAEMDAKALFDPGVLRQFFDLGLMGIEIPEEFGGAESSFFMAILAVEELSRVDASAGVICDVQNTLVNNALKRWGTPGLQKKYLPRLATEWVGAYALSEATSGSDAFSLNARAELKGDKYLLNGQKLWITNGKEAELFIVFATVDPTAGYRGITGFVVEKGFPGFTLGKKEDKLGIRASSSCEVLLDSCEVPVENVLRDV
ncbi:MAG: acyl-CoA dehydrogenase family protein, partial [Acidobacteriota bacterium]